MTEIRIGGRLRHLRQLRGMGLRELAKAAGCSPSFLSRVENGVVSPSLSTLHSIVTALDTNIAELFAEETAEPEWISRQGRRPVIEMDPARKGTGLYLERLIPYAKGHLLQANIHVVAPGGESDGAISHLGQELGYVLEGQLDLTLEGETYRVHTGDSFFFDSQRAHGYRNPGPGTARIIWVNTPPTF